MRALRALALSASMVALAPSFAVAQASLRSSADNPASIPAVAGPTFDNARAGISAPSATDDPAADPAAAAQARRHGPGVALMVVGGAALLAGLIIGGDAGTVIAVGGVVLGLIGLYQYFQ